MLFFFGIAESWESPFAFLSLVEFIQLYGLDKFEELWRQSRRVEENHDLASTVQNSQQLEALNNLREQQEKNEGMVYVVLKRHRDGYIVSVNAKSKLIFVNFFEELRVSHQLFHLFSFYSSFANFYFLL